MKTTYILTDGFDIHDKRSMSYQEFQEAQLEAEKTTDGKVWWALSPDEFPIEYRHSYVAGILSQFVRQIESELKTLDGKSANELRFEVKRLAFDCRSVIQDLSSQGYL